MSTGDILTLDKYKLLNCLASGQSSQVWEIAEGDSSRRLAMKLLLPEALQDADRKAALKHEAKVGGSMQHPNILKYYETVVNKKNGYFVMEYFRSPNLKIQIGSDLTSVHVRIKRLIEQLAAALDHIHEKGWLHKDMKPDNILFSKGSELRLIDFSLSGRPTGALSKMLGGGGTIQGTRTYIAPEQILRRSLTPATDVYSLGITLFEVLTGKVPFKGTTPDDLLKRHLTETAPTPSAFNSNIAPEMDRLIMRMLSKKPDLRPRNMTEFMAEFRTVKVFKEEVKELDKEQIKKMQEEELAKSIDKRLDSRADALRQSMLQTKEGTAGTESKTPVPATKPAAKAPAPAAASGAVPAQPGAPRPPGVPGAPPPGARPVPGAPPAGMPRPPYPGQPYPQGMPGGPPRPPGPYPPGMVPPGMPRPPQPGMPMQPGQPYPPGMYPQQPGMPGGYPQGAPYPPQPGMPPMGAPRPPGYPPGMAPPGMPRPPMPGMPYPPGMQPPGQAYPPGAMPPPRPPQPPGPPPQR